MHKTRNLLLFALVGASLIAIAEPAEARRGFRLRRPATPPDAQAVADRCVSILDRIATHVEGRYTRISDRVSDRIADLVANGEDAAAQHLMDRFNAFIDRSSDKVLSRLDRLAARCVHRLESLDADPTLVDQVNAACDLAKDRVADARDAATGTA